MLKTDKRNEIVFHLMRVVYGQEKKVLPVKTGERIFVGEGLKQRSIEVTKTQEFHLGSAFFVGDQREGGPTKEFPNADLKALVSPDAPVYGGMLKPPDIFKGTH